ncbi:MAG: DUF3105 domain-containing protein [Dehalococcoidia bacterium]|nr:DUF3105 domain-containing protein [Dehalococcoidia bacterium]
MRALVLRRAPWLPAGVAACLLLALAACGGGGGGAPSTGATAAPVSNYPYPVQRLDEVQPGHKHLAAGETFDGYNSNPPTSGPHAPAAAAWGVSDVVVTKEAAVHNMEHAGVVVWYNCNGGTQPLGAAGCTTLRSDLAGLVQAALGRGKLVLMTPYPSMEHRIALTAWQFLDAFDEFDGDRVQQFIDTFVCHTDTERVCK